MSNSDFKAGGDAPRKPQDPASPRDADDLDTGADELRAMLRKLGDQIAATDRRNSETLAEMQARLSQIGGHADVAKSNQPPDPDRAADDPAATVVGPAGGGQHDPDLDRPLFGRSEPADEDRFAHPVPEAAPQQPMFISSSSPQPWALRSAVGLTSGPDALTPFASGEPWDRDAADALTRIYESGEATRSSRMDFRMPPPPSAAEPASSRTMGDVDRPWLEERFAQIALRIEQSVSDMRSGTAIQDLSPKFDQLEQRIIATLDLLATRADVDGLKHVEAHVNELFTHVEHATAQLARLDSIELQLNALGDRLGDDRIVRLAAELMPTEAELTALAEVAADRAVAKLTSAQPGAASLSGVSTAGPASDDRVSSIEELLRSSIEERRHNEEQTAAVLETLQQAMQYMIDRVQMIEHVAMQGPASADGHADAATSREPAAVDESLSVHPDVVAPVTFAEDRAPEPVRLDAPHSARAHASEPDRAPSPGSEWALLPTRPEELTPPTSDVSPRSSQDESALQNPPQASSSEQAAPVSRDDFIAAARRAARKASGQPTRDLPEAPPPPPAKSSSQAAARLWADVKAKLGPRPAVLTAACVGAALLIGGAVMYGASFRPMTIFAKGERRTLPVETEVPGKEGKGASLTPTSPTDLLKRSTAALEPRFEASAAVATPPSPSASNPASLGIMLQTGSTTLTAEQLAEIRRQQQVAAMSQRLARMQAEETAKAGAPLPTVLASAAAPAPATTPAKAESSAASSMPKLSMPPAAVGPNSLRVAAANGDASAQFEVAARFAEGRGIKQDFKQALVWYQRSAAQSFVPAQYRLATLYERGLGVEADQARALLWYKRAAEGGSVKAMHNLAALTANRTDTAPDYATAARWFTSAAERGLADSQYNLGILAESGLGLERDLAAAYKWFSLAANQGDKDAVKRRDVLKAHLSLEQLRKADQEISTWKAEAADAQINDDRMAGEVWKTRATEAG